MDPKGKVALVTGGARRVGRGISLGLARAGAHVVINYNRSADEAERTVADLQALGVRALAVQGDVARPEDVHNLIAQTRDTFGRLDILVNSAATFERTPFLEITPEAWDHVLDVNLKGPFMLTQSAAPLLSANGDGAIVNIADLSALQAWPSFAHHGAAKAGLVNLTRVAARALAPAIRVNCIVPGTVLPPEAYDGIAGDGTRERRLVADEGQPDDVARAVLYLIESNFVTGDTLIVDGGRHLL
jgi:NAD(P)-dependent dehydrogenase (short-subunit alcohol dehydrogenase family)